MLKAIATQIEEALKARFKLSDAEIIRLSDLVVSEGDVAWQGWVRYEIGGPGRTPAGILPGAVKIRIHKDASHAAALGPVLQFYRQE